MHFTIGDTNGHKGFTATFLFAKPKDWSLPLMDGTLMKSKIYQCEGVKSKEHREEPNHKGLKLYFPFLF
jgi:hypothetical protein